MDKDDLEEELSEFIKALDENVDILTDIEYEIESQKEDEVSPNMTLPELIDMTEDVSQTSKLRKAESNFMKRQAEN